MAKKTAKTVKTATKKVVKKTTTSKAAGKKITKSASNAKPKKVIKVSRVGNEVVPVTEVTTAVVWPKSNARVELWAYDEYSQGSIVASGTDLAKIIERAKQFITEQNVENALAAAEKNNTWEAHFPLFFNGSKQNTNLLYAGNKRDGKHYAYSYEDGKWTIGLVDKKQKARFYLGQLNDGRKKSDWYLADHKGVEITSLDSQALERKTVLFVKIV